MMDKIEKARQLANLGKVKKIEFVESPLITEKTFGEVGNQITLTLKPLLKKKYEYIDPDLPIKHIGYTVGEYIEILKKFDSNLILLYSHEVGMITVDLPEIIKNEDIVGNYINEEEYEGNDDFLWLR